VQLPRLKRLYLDLADVLSPLFPPDHRILQTLNSHIAPTSSPLLSAVSFLKELLQALRERCAPVRDELIDRLYTKLDDWREPLRPPFNTPKEVTPALPTLAALVVDTCREIVTLAEYMKADLNTAVIGSMGEEDLKAFVVQQAKAKERQLVLELWASNDRATGRPLRELWRSWIAADPNLSNSTSVVVAADKKWILRLMRQVSTNLQLSCPLPISPQAGEAAGLPNSNTDPNELPPQFLFVTPRLVYVQNFLQAITIAASLRSLTRLPVFAPSSSENLDGHPPGYDLVPRIWSLLKSEIDEEYNGPSDGYMSTKLINLSDEVIRARRLVSSTGNIDADEEQRLRNAVERTLRPQDPVFLLLHRRLVDAITQHLLRELEGDRQAVNAQRIPEAMKTGRVVVDNRPVKRTRLGVPDLTGPLQTRQHLDLSLPVISVKGFEDPTLVEAIRAVVRELLACITWVEMVWGDLV